jgi:hypothetical protein
MRRLLACLATVWLGVSICACGGAGTHSGSSIRVSSAAASDTTTGTTSSVSSSIHSTIDNDNDNAFTKADNDSDNDNGAPGDDKNNNSVLYAFHAASPADERAITSLIKRYYAVALAGQGAKACSMIYSTLAESVPEDYGLSPPGPPYMRGTTCPVVLSLMFKHFHTELAAELPKLEVARVRLQGHRGLAVLHFGKVPQRQLQVAREGHVWKLASLLDSELP